ncbi:MAG TPA: diguanylate cyclase, partial [Candidatus Obscuribacter sp.]|nr:diguanylate cyclase [Candidatus Obscuribacter sp.]
FQAGANDFLSKPVLVDELLSRINGQLAKSAQGKESLAKDANTGLLNEDAFVKAAGELLQATTPQTPMAMALIAADDVEGIRLVHGIESLRQALVALGGEIRLRFKAEDVRGKIGYDAYALLLKDTTKEVAADAIALLQEEFTSRSFFGDRGNFKLDFSTGITDSTEAGRGIKPLLKQAYQRMLSVRGTASGRINYAD